MPNCTHNEDMSQSKAWVPILFECVDADLTIGCNVWMENLSQEVACNINGPKIQTCAQMKCKVRNNRQIQQMECIVRNNRQIQEKQISKSKLPERTDCRPYSNIQISIARVTHSIYPHMHQRDLKKRYQNLPTSSMDWLL